MKNLVEIAQFISEEVGGAVGFRAPYRFAIPVRGDIETRFLSAAVFSSSVPSVYTAMVALVDETADGAPTLEELGYFGAPLVLVRSNSHIATYVFEAPLVAQLVDRSSEAELSRWVRGPLLTRVAGASQLALPLAQSRDLVVNETTKVLSHQISEFMNHVMSDEKLDESQAFQMAIGRIREMSLGAPRADAPAISNFRFAHVPVEAIAELYESLGLQTQTQRSLGTVYTPAWLARYVVSRLPRTQVLQRAVDPTCGSGTFLVAYLESVADSLLTSEHGVEERFVRAVGGFDIDPVAVEAARLSLDLFVQRLDLPPLNWELEVRDATANHMPATLLIGNLPFGHRTHGGTDDVSSVILQHWLRSVVALDGLGLILPDSFAYGEKSREVRELLRERFRLDELIRLPEEVFERSSAPTLVLFARRGAEPDPGEVLVRDVSRSELRAFRVSGIAKTFGAQLPPQLSDPWPLSPFLNELARAGDRKATTLGNIARVHLGLQAYGTSDAAFGSEGPRVLEDPKMFLTWKAGQAERLRRFVGLPSDLRRTGPIDLYQEKKVVLRATTNSRQKARMASVYDTIGLWFSDKFVGVWATGSLSPRALAAYFQTRFAEVWFSTNNPSRKMRISVMQQMPIPKFPADWWARAELLTRPDELTLNPRWQSQADQLTFMQASEGHEDEWRWFDDAVDTAFGITASASGEMEEFLTEYLTVGSLPT